MHDEYIALCDKHVFNCVPLPEEERAIECRWMFKMKQSADGGPPQYKARLVALGCAQKYTDFDETFAPKVCPQSIRVCLTIAALKGYVTSHVDINTAYLNTELHHNIYMACPPGYEGEVPGDVWHLHRVLYGLKQSVSRWWECLDSALVQMGFKSTSADPCIYINHSETYLIIFVDDILILAQDDTQLQQVTNLLKERFTLKELGEVCNYVEMQLEKTPTGGYFWHQSDKIRQLLLT